MAARRLLGIARGFPGHPSHPPLTDATIGVLTVGVALVLLAWIGITGEASARAAVLVVSFGLVLAAPTLVTGFLDYLAIPRGTPRWRTASLHWLSMLFAVGVFLVAAALLSRGYDDGEVTTAGAVAALAGEALLLLGGWLGGTLVFVHGERVLAKPGERAEEAIVPRSVEHAPEPHEGAHRR